MDVVDVARAARAARCDTTLTELFLQIDTIKTRVQRATAVAGETAYSRTLAVASAMLKQEGVSSFYKGITPRVIRVAPGQAVVFVVYEKVKLFIETPKEEDPAVFSE